MSIVNLDNYVLVDIETTGLDNSDEILEIGALRVVNHKITQSFDLLCKPTKHIPIEASDVHHIYDKDVENCHTIDFVIQAFANFINDDDVLMGHNISAFDIKYLNRALNDVMKKDFPNKVYDTLFASRREMKFLGSHSLQTLSAYYGIDYTKAHRAVQDCFINYQVYEKMLHDTFPELKICPKCGNILKLKLGKYSWFYGCSNYPECTHTANFEVTVKQ